MELEMERLTQLAARIGKDFEEGEVVFRQGDPGDSMYIVQKGAVAVVREQEGSRTVVARLNPGDFFGEMALVDRQPRSATVKALEKTTLVPVNRDFLLKHSSRDARFILAVMESLSGRLEKVDEMLRWRHTASGSPPAPPPETGTQEPRSAAFLKGFSGLAQKARPLRLKKDEVLFRQGEKGDCMYIILEGEVQVCQEGDGTRFVQASFGRGNFFGEMALVSGRPRAATAVASTDATLLPVTREDFLERVRTNPDVALHTVQVLIVRLRRALEQLD